LQERPELAHKKPLSIVSFWRLERLARDKHFSFFENFTNYGRKSFITLGVRWRGTCLGYKLAHFDIFEK
jgi:hypothetical protein